MNFEDLDTPSLIVDLERMQRNMKRMVEFEEHGWIRLSGEGRQVKPGERIRFVPAHCRTSVNQPDEM